MGKRKRRPERPNELYFPHLQARLSREREQRWRVNGQKVQHVKRGPGAGATLILRDQTRYVLSAEEWVRALALETAEAPVVQEAKATQKAAYHRPERRHLSKLEREVKAWANEHMERYINWSAARAADVTLDVRQLAEDAQVALQLHVPPYDLVARLGAAEGFVPNPDDYPKAPVSRSGMARAPRRRRGRGAEGTAGSFVEAMLVYDDPHIRSSLERARPLIVLNDPDEVDFERITQAAQRAVIVCLRDYRRVSVVPSEVSVTFQPSEEDEDLVVPLTLAAGEVFDIYQVNEDDVALAIPRPIDIAWNVDHGWMDGGGQRRWAVNLNDEIIAWELLMLLDDDEDEM